MKFDLSLVIPIYKRYKNVYDFLFQLRESGLKFNNIHLIMDKLELNKISNIFETVEMYHYKNLILSNFKDAHIVSYTEFKGKPGLVGIPDVIGESNDSRIVYLEDDISANKHFFEQCEEFFSSRFSPHSPIFIGYTNTNQVGDLFFETYCSIPQWGLVTTKGVFIELTRFYSTVTKEEKEKIIDYVINTRFCGPFERYKKEIVDANVSYFLNRPNSVDVFFMFYLLSRGLKVWKNTQCSITLDTGKPTYRNHTVIDPAEMDILNALYLWRV